MSGVDNEKYFHDLSKRMRYHDYFYTNLHNIDNLPNFMKKHKRETRKIEMGTHSGTHIDAPRHFLGGNKSVDSIPIENLVGDATVLNFSKLKKIDLNKFYGFRKIFGIFFCSGSSRGHIQRSAKRRICGHQ